MTEADAANPAIINRLAQWRRDNLHVYLTRVPPTDEDVRDLLRDYAGTARDYLLFFVTCGGKK